MSSAQIHQLPYDAGIPSISGLVREAELLDHAMIKRRVRIGMFLRTDTQALVTLIDGEKDGLPDLLTHSYSGIAGCLVYQFNANGAEPWKVPVV